jgi:hypothetical protein
MPFWMTLVLLPQTQMTLVLLPQTQMTLVLFPQTQMTLVLLPQTQMTLVLLPEIQLIQSLFSNKTKGHKQDNQNLLKSSVSEGGELRSSVSTYTYRCASYTFSLE